ncbi:MAG: hypothetical protein HZB46_07640 [Solirubrobacterales bacterium]|nr:hypothetical protein [Solirubrobacterales bacterium]
MAASVLVPLLQAPHLAGAALAALAPLRGAGTEVVALVTEPAAAPEGADVVVAVPPGTGLAAAATLAMERVHREVVVLLREGGVPEPGWLTPLAAALRDPGVAAVTSIDAQAAEGTAAVGAPAIAWRRADLPAVPPVHDALVVAALCMELARRGEVEVAAASLVTTLAGGSAAA